MTEPPPDRGALCALAAGHLQRFTGLSHLTGDAVPDCLRATGETRTLAISHARLIGRVHLTETGDPLTVYTSAAHPRVQLVELVPSPGWAASDLAALPAPELRIGYDRRLQDHQGLAGAGAGTVEEEVHAGRGLALLYLHADGAAQLRRVRAFPATTATAYRDRFARVPPIVPLP